MIDIVFFFRWYYITHMITPGNIDFDMFRFDNLREMLKWIEDLISEVAIDHV